MLNRTDLRGSSADPRGLLPRAQLDVSAALAAVRPTVEAVREHGFAAVRAVTEKFCADLVVPKYEAFYESLCRR